METYVDRLGSDPSIVDRLSVGADFDFDVDRHDIDLRVPELTVT